MVTVYDFETLKNCYLACYKERSKPSDFDFLNNNDTEKYLKLLNESKWYDFEVSEYRNDLPLLIDFLKRGEITGQIGYNCVRFDSQIQQYILKNASYLISLEALEFCRIIHEYANDVVDRSNNRKFLDFPEWKIDIEQCDPMLINHYDNQAKSTSLKWLQFSMNWPDIIEMDVDHNVGISSEEDAINLRKYCHNDILSTEAFYWITKGETNHPEYKGKDQVALRKDVSAMINKSCINWNDVKIGEQLNFINYSSATGKTKNELYQDKQEAYKGKIHLFRCVPKHISFKTKLLQDVLSEINNTIVDARDASFKKTITIGYSTHTMALGGIHSTEAYRRVVVGSDEVCIDADVGGQYPSAIIRRGLFPSHLSIIWNKQIEKNVLKRSELKPLAKTDKKAASWSEAYKLANNGGGYGKLGEITNWQYDLECMYSVTIGCQLEILMLIEELELNGISVISSNTDGIVSLMKKHKEELYYKICKEWEEKTNSTVFGKLEFANYKEIVSMSVNDYLAIKTDNTVKYKGDFIYDPLLHKNKSRRIVPLALKAYFVDKIEPEKFIREHKAIYDFCCAVRADSTMTLQILRGGKYHKQQKTVRYYIANSRDVLVKLMKPLANKKVTYQIDIFGKVDIGTREHEVEAGYKVNVFNTYVHKENFNDYNINYDYYIKKVRDKINDMELFKYTPTVIQ
jgi:hypothetical protein